MTTYYQIAGILILIESEYELKDDDAFSIYRMDPQKAHRIPGKFCYKITVARDGIHPPLEGKRLYSDLLNLYLEKDGKVFRFFKIPLANWLAAWCETTGTRSLTIHYQAAAGAYFERSTGCFNAASFETILYTFNKYLFHCSYIDVGGEAILFTAHSGGGKTTHGILWEKSGHGEMINGDRAVLEKTKKTAENTTGYIVHGLPIAGSSNVFKNRSLPLKAIFILEKSHANEVVDLPLRQQFIKVFEQMTIHSWDSEFVDAVAAFTEGLVCTVPVRLLRCRPDLEAVEVVRNVMNTNE